LDGELAPGGRHGPVEVLFDGHGVPIPESTRIWRRLRAGDGRFPGYALEWPPVDSLAGQLLRGGLARTTTQSWSAWPCHWEDVMSVEVGDRAPDFTLMDQNRTPVTLGAVLQNGPAVLAFFPAAFSSVCQNELCTFRDSIATLTASDGQVLGISTDTFFTLKAWAEQQRFTFPLLSDYNKTVIRSYGVVNPDMIGLKDIAKRAVFVIGRDGIVRHREVLEDARNEPDYGKVRAALAGSTT
jgi:peroxiredoxin